MTTSGEPREYGEQNMLQRIGIPTKHALFFLHTNRGYMRK
jgi:hypothetical protein